ncbi:MAG TPA: glycine-rich protein [Aquiluna sp.]
MNKKWLATLTLALLPTAMVVPQSVASTPACIGNNCEITFSYTGDYQAWSPPEGIKDLTVEMYGAAGGRGGAGGKITARFDQIPETIYIFVGEAGGMGSGIEGGFNGGGFSGGNSGTEGAGGGATDIRTDLDLESRILVAGGAGGGGGEAGGNGAHGGGEVAVHGGSGQASGGGGANQSEGGFAGVNNGGFQMATQGQFGFGGSGGFSTFAGGGGGGGGWYGGGGGGADDNTCCSDGGGGGGGSSYANTDYFTDIGHEAGVNWGHGWLTLRYQVLPTISYLDLIQVNSERAVFSIEASEDFVGLEIEDLLLEGAGCSIDELSTNGQIASGVINGCDDGTVSLSVLPESFGVSVQGPPQLVSTQMQFDGQAPEFSFSTQEFASALSAHVIEFNVSDQLQLSSTSFSVSNCAVVDVFNSELLLSSCSEGVVSVALMENTLVDSWQNIGPAEPITMGFTIDQTAPTATWSEIAISGDGPFSYSAALEFSEPVSVSNLALAFASSALCEANSELLDTKLLVSASCSYSSLEWSFAGQVTDAVGNLMATQPLVVRLDNPAPPPPPPPAPAPAPTPVSNPVPVAPAPVVVPPVIEEPAAEPEPVTQSPATTESDSVSAVSESATASDSVETEPAEQEVETATESTVVVVTPPSPVLVESDPIPSVETDQVQLQPAELEISEEAEVIEGASEPPIAEPTPTFEPQPEQEPVLAQPVLGEGLAEEQPGFPWWPVALLVAIGALGVGAWRLSGR